MTDTYHLHKEMEAARALREALGASPNPENRPFDDDAVDQELVRDMLEGETNLNEMIAQTVQSLDEDMILEIGLKEIVGALRQRHERIKKRIENKRAAIEQAMLIAERKTMELPTMTITLKDKPAALVVVDESRIPGDYWQPQDPKLDRKVLLQALKDGQTIDGADLDTGGVSLQMRRN